MTTKRMKIALSVLAATLAFPLVAVAQQSHKLTINLLVHSASTNPFWQPVRRGMEAACQQVGADCKLLFVQREGDTANQLRNLQTSVTQKVDGIVTTITDDKAFDQPIADAVAKGIAVVAFNVDDTEGGAGNARLGFVGQSFVAAGHALGVAMAKHFPKTGPVHVLVGISAPGQNWSESRGKGIMLALEEWKKANPSQRITWERIDSGTDLAITSQRVTAYLDRNPNTNAYLETGFWEVGVAQALKTRGVPPGKITLGGFDLVPAVLDRMQDGYVQGTVDQQPYLQGYLAVMQVALMRAHQLSGWEVNTGSNIITPDQVGQIRKLSIAGVR